jgi:hypothetical protein
MPLSSYFNQKGLMTMTENEVRIIAKALGRLAGRRGNPPIDEETRRECVDEIELLISTHTPRFSGAKSMLEEFRDLAKVGYKWPRPQPRKDV